VWLLEEAIECIDCQVRPHSRTIAPLSAPALRGSHELSRFLDQCGPAARRLGGHREPLLHEPAVPGVKPVADARVRQIIAKILPEILSPSDRPNPVPPVTPDVRSSTSAMDANLFSADVAISVPRICSTLARAFWRSITLG
jgi:hypothetical protein